MYMCIYIYIYIAQGPVCWKRLLPEKAPVSKPVNKIHHPPIGEGSEMYQFPKFWCRTWNTDPSSRLTWKETDKRDLQRETYNRDLQPIHPHETRLGIHRLSNPFTGNQRMSTPAHWWVVHMQKWTWCMVGVPINLNVVTQALGEGGLMFCSWF